METRPQQLVVVQVPTVNKEEEEHDGEEEGGELG